MNNADLLSVPLTSLSVCVNWWWALVLSREGKPVVGHLCDTSISPYHPFTLSICPCPSLFLSISLSPAVTHFSNLHFQTSHPLHKVITHQLLKQYVWMYACPSVCMLAHHKRLVTFLVFRLYITTHIEGSADWDCLYVSLSLSFSHPQSLTSKHKACIHATECFVSAGLHQVWGWLEKCPCPGSPHTYRGPLPSSCPLAN